MQLPIKRARTAFVGFMSSLAIVFVVIFLALNAMLFLLITRPVQRLSAIADEVSLGNMDAPQLQLSGNDEIAKLTQSFGRMRKSMAEALKMLETP